MVVNIQFLRLIAALMIVFTHAIAFGNQKLGLGQPFLDTVEIFLRMGVDIFFVISGFIMVITTRDRQLSAASFLYKRASRIYPVYWLICLLLLPVLILKPEWVNSSSSVSPSFWHSFFLVPSEGAPLLMVAWTLEFEAFFYVIFACTLSLGTKKQLIVMTALFVVAAAWGLGNPYIDEEAPLRKMMTSTLLLEFVAGMWLGYFYPKLKGSLTLLMLCCSGLVLSSLAILPLENYPRGLVYIFPAVFTVFIFLILEKRGVVFNKNVSLWGGNLSYTLYLVHVPVLAALGRLWLSFSTEIVSVEIVLLGVVIVSFMAAIVLFFCVERPALKLLRKYWKV